MKDIELMNVLQQTGNKMQLLCKIFPSCGGPWIGFIKAGPNNNGKLILNSYGVNGGVDELGQLSAYEFFVLDLRSSEALNFLELVEKEKEAEEIRNKIRKDLGLPAFR